MNKFIFISFLKNNKRFAFAIFILQLCFMFFLSCTSKVERKDVIVNRDFNTIKSNNKIKILLDYSSTNYFVYRGEAMGFEYDVLKRFAKKYNLILEVRIVTNMDSIFYFLNNGFGDIAAGNLTVTRGRERDVLFTDAILYTRQVLVQKKPVHWQTMKRNELDAKLIKDKEKLFGREVYVRKNSSYYSQLRSISTNKNNPIKIIESPGYISTEELIEKVANNEIEFTVTDLNIALANHFQFPDIDIGTFISPPTKIAWAVRKTSPMLLDTLNQWFAEYKKSKEFKSIQKKYFGTKQQRTLHAREDFLSEEGGQISPFDEIIKKYAQKLNWDWKLLASLIYQESKFNANAESWAGAKGVMQLMPSTAEKFGINSTSTIEQQVNAGVKLLFKIDEILQETVSDSSERIKFVLASYNVGLGHVQDAQRLAEKYEKQPMIWENNVDYYLLHKSEMKYYRDNVVKFGICRGRQPYYFVLEVLARYEHYKNMEEAGKLKDPI